MRQFLALLAAGVALLLGLPLPASASVTDDSIKKLDVEITLDESGTAHVKERFEWNFADGQGHGFYRTITKAQAYDPEPNNYRVYEVSNEQVTSPSGAPA
ncbi:hypothetical protein BSZ39_12330 [Bowdeniella nasicola]|uniref:DUF2207 domain-containing protein n=1 Tax=Bowdeniella nasicola TaxID=208480 RepID=A0A1Q5PZ63_9ACTO|nr:DUF2207 domain-containing protein [Bowdeniella nasicola]OKL52921.1 hypothetical protein BSZ39_12330 [Bowdeniella nasicola]